MRLFDHNPYGPIKSKKKCIDYDLKLRLCNLCVSFYPFTELQGLSFGISAVDADFIIHIAESKSRPIISPLCGG